MHKKLLSSVLIFIIIVNVFSNILVYANFENCFNEDNVKLDCSEKDSSSLMIKTSNIDEIKQDEDIEKITEISNELYIIDYKNEKDVDEKYENLSNADVVDEVAKDLMVTSLEIKSSIQSVNSNNYSWGRESMGIDHYLDYLDYKQKDEILIAVLDTGINPNHEAFTDSVAMDKLDLRYAHNYAYEADNENYYDGNGHGTMVASIIAQATPSNVKIVPIKVLGADGKGYISDFIRAINDIKDKVDIINLSLGINISSFSQEEYEDSFKPFNDSIEEFYDNGNGPIIVAASGNEGVNRVSFPACNPRTIGVSALEKNDIGNTSFANYSNYGAEVDFSAPGSEIDIADYGTTTEYCRGNGTSFATPHISSAIALLKSEYSLNTFDEVMEKLKDNCDDLGEQGKDVKYGYGSVNFITNKFEKPVIANVSEENGEVKVRSICDDKIMKYAILNTSDNITDDKWIIINNPSTNVEIKFTLSENINYNIYFMDEENEISFVTWNVPEDSFSKVNNGVNYTTHIQSIGWQNYVSNGEMAGTSGRNLRLEAIKIKLDDNNYYSGNIEYRSHIQGIGWENNWKRNDELSGTSGRSLRLEAVQIRLTGDIAEYYDVCYCVHVQGFGWLNWAKNGEESGTSGYGKRLEAIEIKLVKKGELLPKKLGNNDSRFIKYVPPAKVSYATHVQGIGWQNYVSNGAMSGTSGKGLRLEAIKIKLENLSGGIKYKTHIQGIGWENTWKSNNSLSGTSGRGLRLEAIQINLTGEAAEKYDIYYHVHVQGFGWLGWAKNGENAGTAGYGKRLEEIEIKLVVKGGAAPGNTLNRFKQK